MLCMCMVNLNVTRERILLVSRHWEPLKTRSFYTFYLEDLPCPLQPLSLSWPRDEPLTLTPKKGARGRRTPSFSKERDQWPGKSRVGIVR